MSRTRARAFLYVSSVAVVALAVVGLVARLLASRVLDVEGTPDIQVRLPADQLFTVTGVPLTNAMLSCWLASLALVVFFLAARWRARRAPRGRQNVAEALLEALFDLVQGAAGARQTRYDARQGGPRRRGVGATAGGGGARPGAPAGSGGRRGAQGARGGT